MPSAPPHRAVAHRLVRSGFITGLAVVALTLATLSSSAWAAPPEERRAAAQRKADAEACYRDAARQFGEVVGKVTLRFELDEQGAVSSVQVEHNTTNASRIGKCLQRRARSWSFPPPHEGVAVTRSIPFVFSQ